jgi:hypothetical protein
MTGILGLTAFFSPAPAVWAGDDKNPDNSYFAAALSTSQTVPPFDNSDIAAALSTAQAIPHEAEELASSFVERTLPRLLTDDARMAKHLGFSDARGSTVALEQPLPLMIMFHGDVVNFITGRHAPLDLINNTNNWMQDRAGKLVPRRIIFSLKVDGGTSESRPHSWSSVTLEMSPSNSWRVFQVGAPQLARAMKLYEAPGTSQFLLWIPDLNRHYLGQIRAPKHDASHSPVILTTLFNDPLAERSPGEQFDVTSGIFIERLKKLYHELQLSKALQRQTSQEHERPSTK